MKKITFREYLMEVDVGDLDWAKSMRPNRRAPQDNRIDPNNPQQQQQAEKPTPKRSNVLIDKYGQKFSIQGIKNGQYITKQLGGSSTQNFSVDTNFEYVGKSQGGQPVFKEV